MIVERIGRGLGLIAGPGPGNPGTLSNSSGVSLGALRLVPSLGRIREATYYEIYLTNPWVWASVNMISRGLARNPLHAYALDAQGRKRRVRGDLPQSPGRPSGGALLDRLLSAPNPPVSGFAQLRATAKERLIYGNSLWEIERTTGFPSALKRIRWRAVRRVIEGENGMPVMYEVSRDQRRTSLSGGARVLLPGDVIHFGLGSEPETAIAISPLESCSATLALHDALVRHLIAYFTNSARQSGHVKVDRLTREKAQLIRELIDEMYASPENAGKVLVTSGDWQPTSDAPDHSQIIELIKTSREEIAAAYAVPPPVLGILEQAIKSNVKELREQYVRDSVGPWACEFEQEFEAQLLAGVPSWASLFVEFQLAEQLRPDLEARSLVYSRLKSVFSIDEIRAFENAEPLDIPGVTDVPWVDSGAMPVTRAGAKTSAAARAAAGNGHVHELTEIP